MAILLAAGLGAAGLMGAGLWQKSKKNHFLGNSLMGIGGGALAAVALLSDQWTAWFPQPNPSSTDGLLSALPSLQEREARCLEDLPKKYLACGLDRSDLKRDVHFTLNTQIYSDGFSCEFDYTDELKEICEKHREKLHQERIASGAEVLKICFDTLSKEELERLCIEQIAKKDCMGLDPATITRDDFEGLKAIIPEEVMDSLHCDYSVTPRLSQRCNEQKFKTICVGSYEKELRTHLYPDMPPLQEGEDYTNTTIKESYQDGFFRCNRGFTPQMKPKLHLLECIKAFKNDQLPGCKDRFINIKKYFTQKDCKVRMPGCDFETLKAACQGNKA